MGIVYPNYVNYVKICFALRALGLTRRVVAVRVDARDLHLAHVDTRRLRNALAERQEHSCRLRVCEDTRADQQQYPRPAAPLAL